ncbi:hypothetical protein [Tumebacillus permanentifrigoris]|uniref:Uncharacterized protein n=1 Tax=Tumebacillus permanentifrigoris TaxID=378543 RepID=A0A316D805_9BACL|nr:hypothetical protein [Tumebacillus permanentifrigoris]PWK10191.1 hypothetical protein C7459_11212 [Tumebacillus permanentifrigoris]
MKPYSIVRSTRGELGDLHIRVIAAMKGLTYAEIEWDICQAIGEVKPIMKLTADEARKVLAYRLGEEPTAC